MLGPMTGLPDHNREAFRAAAGILRSLGHDPISPIELDEAEGIDFSQPLTEDQYAHYLGRDIEKIAGLLGSGDLDGGVALEGWEASRGAPAEAHVIRALGRPIYRLAHEPPGPYGSQEPHPYLEILQDSVTARHSGSERFHAILRGLGTLHDKKQQDYGRDNNPFANVRGSSEWGVADWVGAMVRATDKVRRLQTYARRGTLANEGVIDAFDDLAVYAVIARVLFEEGQGHA